MAFTLPVTRPLLYLYMYCYMLHAPGMPGTTINARLQLVLSIGFMLIGIAFYQQLGEVG